MHIVIDNASKFRDAFHQAGRGKQFSYEALGLLFEFFEEMDDSMELDVVAICCDYAEESTDSVISSYSIEVEEGATEEDKLTLALDYLQEHTFLIGLTVHGLVYQQF